jgi:hypothetical protein
MNNTLSWPYLFDYYIKEIENDPADLIGSPIDNIEDELIDEEDEQEDNEDDEYLRELRSE